jgi:anti-sigma factor ChrR (cupin superfamily)
MPMDVRVFALSALGSSGEFKPFRDGVEVCWLYGESGGGRSAALLRYSAGARVPRHRHNGFEHVLILEGSQCDDRGCYDSGTLVVNEPETEHAVWTTGGCLVLVIWEQSVTFVNSR